MPDLEEITAKPWKILIMGDRRFHVQIIRRLNQIPDWRRITEVIYVSDIHDLERTREKLEDYDAAIIDGAITPTPPEVNERVQETEMQHPYLEIRVLKRIRNNTHSAIPPDLLERPDCDPFYVNLADCFTMRHQKRKKPVTPVPEEYGRKTLYVILGPSGTGKSSVMKLLMPKLEQRGFSFSRGKRMLTRPQELFEDDDIIPATREEFTSAEREGKLLATYQLYGYDYGIERESIMSSQSHHGVIHITGCPIRTLEGLIEKVHGTLDVVPILLYTDISLSKARVKKRNLGTSRTSYRYAEINRQAEEYFRALKMHRFAHAIYSVAGDKEMETEFGIRHVVNRLRRIIEFTEINKHEMPRNEVGTWKQNTRYVNEIISKLFGVPDLDTLKRCIQEGTVNMNIGNTAEYNFSRRINREREYVHDLCTVMKPVFVGEAYGRATIFFHTPATLLKEQVMRDAAGLIEYVTKDTLLFASPKRHLSAGKLMPVEIDNPARARDLGILSLTDIGSASHEQDQGIVSLNFAFVRPLPTQEAKYKFYPELLENLKTNTDEYGIFLLN